jgi:hypothetical protein
VDEHQAVVPVETKGLLHGQGVNLDRLLGLQFLVAFI